MSMILETKGLTMRFGGLTAVSDFSASIPQGSITGLIGPNGAGKTTCFNMVTGFYRPTEGQVFFEGRELTGMTPHQVCRAGIARTFQNIRLFGNETALENVMIGSFVRQKTGWIQSVLMTPASLREERGLREQAMSLLDVVGLAEYHRREPMRQGVSRAELASSFGQGVHPKLVHFLTERLVKSGLILLEGDTLRLPGHVVSLASDQSGLRMLMESTYVQAGLMPPTTKAFLEENNLPAKDAAQMFRLLMEEGVLIKVSEEFYYAKAAMDDITGRVRSFFESNQEMGPQDFRDLTNLTRKFAIPVLEYLDKEKITMRIGDKRQLRKR